ncbi:unnamed protein product [Allacma fusca]|uniref:Fucosyltransferase n=1 Tax=Allacma fusca TaxID=39272 RepID=A0A8J2PFN0_9HEXA|nr:unnamed protein product [Allacma fusca]
MTWVPGNKFVKVRKVLIVIVFTVAINICFLKLQHGGTEESTPLRPSASQLHQDEVQAIIMKSLYEPDVQITEVDQREVEHLPYSNGNRDIDLLRNEYQTLSQSGGDNIKTHNPPSPNDIEHPLAQENTPHKARSTDGQGKKLKKILVWNDYWKSKALWHKIFYEIIYDKCPHSSCILTTEKSQLQSSDAVLYHILDLHKEKYRVPEYRNPNQIWIAMSFEPPYILTYAGVDFPRLNGVFNRTMSYRQDSDIVVRHGRFTRIEERTKLPTFLGNWVGSHDDIEHRNYANGKRRLVAWFASSRGCKSQSNRETYVQQLQQYIPVDIYGSCGPFKCGIQKTIRNPYKVEHDDCYLLVSLAYKFILAFENSICEDYVTEKLYNNLKLNVVPVVLGGSNYSYYAPPNSVIDASQFTPKQLADYLQLLDSDDELYNEYFKWKRDFYVEANDGIPLICDLCDKLNQPQWETEEKVYTHFDTWVEGSCYPSYHGNESIPYATALKVRK